MLQQTVVATVIPYYVKFLAAYPTVFALGDAPLNEVLGMWAGLGYYARARNLHACAQHVASLGAFPNTIKGLRELPGIGPYTANAIGAIAFNLPVLPVDGNVERVAARVFAISEPLPKAKKLIAQTADRLMNGSAARAAPGDYAQALFDLGARVCVPRNPNCEACPWQTKCQAYERGIAADLPRKSQKPRRPHRTAFAYILMDYDLNVLLIRRPLNGLLGGMLTLPEVAPAKARWRGAGTIDHVFTHFSLTLTIKLARVPALPAGSLSAPARTVPLPSVMRKALDAGLNSLDD